MLLMMSLFIEGLLSVQTILALELCWIQKACAAFGLLMSCNAVNEPRSRLDASLRLGAPLSWEMKLSRRP